MKVSLNIVKQFIDFELPSTDELVAKINSQLGGVEEVINLGAKYESAKIVKVVECEKHSNADKLSVCKIDAGEGELIQVVCGANNVKSGMWAVWLPPKSTVPATFDDIDPFVLSVREIRGVKSNGMLASARELGIGDDHDGIVDITERDLPEGKSLVPGNSFAEVFELNDTIIDIENKMFTHRPDLFGQLGIAREIAGIYGRKFSSPDWYAVLPKFESVSDALELDIFNDAPESAPRFMAVAVGGTEVKQSPLWLKCALVAMGGKPINNIVDATNYIMLITAQPVHAYDYDKVRGHKLGVRMARHGETLPLLNGKMYSLTEDDIVIADAEGAIGLAGIMGGANSEVSPETKNLILEVANFNMYSVRKSSMRHGLFTDALTRFNKGQSPLQIPTVMAKLMSLVDGNQSSRVFDIGKNPPKPHSVTESVDFINSRLGLSLAAHEIKSLLENVEMQVSLDDRSRTKESPTLVVTPPFWRTDIELPEDIVEEVGRLYGYDKLPRELPLRSSKPTDLNHSIETGKAIRRALSRAGGNEVLSYSFVHERILTSAGQNPDEAYKLSNALSPDLQYYRLSLTPSLLDKVHGNIKAGHDEFALFEIGKSHSKTLGLDEDGLPLEEQEVALVYAKKKSRDGAAFYRAKSVLEFMASQLGLKLKFEPLDIISTAHIATVFEPKRSAIVSESETGRYIGVIGEYNAQTRRNFKLPDYAAGFELLMNPLAQLVRAANKVYRPLSRFPSVDRDISIRVHPHADYATVATALDDALSSSSLVTTVRPQSIYKPDNGTSKTFTFNVSLTSYDKTLTSQEINKIIDEVSSKLSHSISAEIV